MKDGAPKHAAVWVYAIGLVDRLRGWKLW